MMASAVRTSFLKTVIIRWHARFCVGSLTACFPSPPIYVLQLCDAIGGFEGVHQQHDQALIKKTHSKTLNANMFYLSFHSCTGAS